MPIRSFILVSCVFLAASVFSATTSVVITSPRGGEVFVAGQNQFIRLDDRTKLKTVTLEISRDGGANFLPLGTIDNTVKVGRNVLQFGVTGPTSTNCVIRAKGIQGKTEVTGLSGAFSIVTGNSLGPIATPELADGAVTTPKLADRAATEAKIGSGAASTDMFLKSDGLGGAIFATLSGDGSGITNISETALPVNVTLQGNSINAPNSLLKLDANGTVRLGQGGTGAALTAIDGGVFYSTASAAAILPGVSGAGRILQSGADAAPSWSVASYPSVAGNAGRILISDGNNFATSTPTFPNVAGPAGNVLQSDGANFVSAPNTASTVPSVRVFNDINQVTSHGVDLTLSFNQERFDNSSMHETSVDNSRLVCKKAGKYLIIANVQWAVHSTGTRQFYLMLNGAAQVGIVEGPAPSTTFLRQCVSTIYHLNVGDYMTAVVAQNSGASVAIETGGLFSPEFMMVRVGD